MHNVFLVHIKRLDIWMALLNVIIWNPDFAVVSCQILHVSIVRHHLKQPMNWFCISHNINFKPPIYLLALPQPFFLCLFHGSSELKWAEVGEVVNFHSHRFHLFHPSPTLTISLLDLRRWFNAPVLLEILNPNLCRLFSLFSIFHPITIT